MVLVLGSTEAMMKVAINTYTGLRAETLLKGQAIGHADALYVCWKLYMNDVHQV